MIFPPFCRFELQTCAADPPLRRGQQRSTGQQRPPCQQPPKRQPPNFQPPDELASPRAANGSSHQLAPHCRRAQKADNARALEGTQPARPEPCQEYRRWTCQHANQGRQLCRQGGRSHCARPSGSCQCARQGQRGRQCCHARGQGAECVVWWQVRQAGRPYGAWSPDDQQGS